MIKKVVWILLLNQSRVMISSRNIKKILQSYYSLDFPGSYSGLQTFHESVKANLGINISLNALRKLLKNEMHYQIHFPRKKNLLHRANYARGSNLEAFADVVYLRYGPGNKEMMVFLVVLDVFCRYMYATLIPSKIVNPTTMEKAFKKLFRQKMPSFPLLRVDRDPSTLKLRPYFASRRMLLQVKRGPQYMGVLDTAIRVIENRLSRFLVKYPHANLERALTNVVKSWNQTPVKKLQLTPTEARNPVLDPILRRRLYPKENLLPFDTFLKKQLKLMRKVNTPRPKDDTTVITSHNQWRVGDKCLINYSPHYLTRGYNIKRFACCRVLKLD